MTMVTWFMKRPRLTTLIDAGGGTTVLRALRSADEAIQPLREAALGAIDEVLDEMDAMVPRPDALDRLYALSSSLLDVAGPFGLEDMCKAAYSLCELLDRQRRAGRCDAPPIQVHVASLRLLRQPGEPAESRRQILAGLEILLHREQRPLSRSPDRPLPDVA